MITVSGTYYNGQIKLEKHIRTKRPIKVFVSYEEVEKDKKLELTDFSFLETQELLKGYKGSFSDEVIKERRKAV